jgi:hypothetical protein
MRPLAVDSVRCAHRRIGTTHQGGSPALAPHIPHNTRRHAGRRRASIPPSAFFHRGRPRPGRSPATAQPAGAGRAPGRSNAPAHRSPPLAPAERASPSTRSTVVRARVTSTSTLYLAPRSTQSVKTSFARRPRPHARAAPPASHAHDSLRRFSSAIAQARSHAGDRRSAILLARRVVAIGNARQSHAVPGVILTKHRVSTPPASASSSRME